MKMETKLLGCSKSSTWREVYSKHPTDASQELRKAKTNQAQNQ
jgi:hypothetical protein